MNPILGQPRDPAHNPAHVIWHLGGRIDGQTAALHSCEADMRLQRCMLDLAGLVGSLHNSVRLCERFLHIPDAALVGRCNVVMNICAERELIDHLAFPWILRCLIVVGIQICRCAGTVFHRTIVHGRCAFRHGFLDSQHRFQHFILDMNQILRLLGGFLCLRDNPRDPVSDMADLPVKQPPVMWRRLRIPLPRLHIVDVRTVSRRDDLHDARNLFRFSCVNRFDVGTGIRGPQDNQDTGIRRNIVLDIRPLTADERRTIHLAVRCPDLSELLAEDRRRFGLIVTKLSSLSYQLNCKEVMLV